MIDLTGDHKTLPPSYTANSHTHNRHCIIKELTIVQRFLQCKLLANSQGFCERSRCEYTVVTYRPSQVSFLRDSKKNKIAACY